MAPEKVEETGALRKIRHWVETKRQTVAWEAPLAPVNLIISGILNGELIRVTLSYIGKLLK